MASSPTKPSLTILLPTKGKPSLPVCVKRLEESCDAIPREKRKLIILVCYCPSSFQTSIYEIASQWKGEKDILFMGRHTYWASALRKAEEKIPSNQFLLWLKENTLLQSPLESLLSVRTITTAAIFSLDGTEKLGGARTKHPQKPLFFPVFNPKSHLQKDIQTMDGNCVCFPPHCWKQFPIPEDYIHAFADWDRGLRATQHNLPIRESGIALTEPPPKNEWEHLTSPIKRLSAALHPTGLHPTEWWHFCKTHTPPQKKHLAPFLFLWAYRFILLPNTNPARKI